MNTENTHEIPAEEILADQQDSALPTEEAVRAEIIEATGFDPESEDDQPRIEKLVAKTMDGRKKLSAAIGAKITWREKATKGTEKKPKESEGNGGASGVASLSNMDVLAIMQNNIPQEDVEEVQKYSKLLSKSIPEVLKDEAVKEMLKKRQDLRATENAANVGPKRGGVKKATDQELLDKASRGELPEKGSAEAEQLFHARRGGKRS